MSTDPFRDLELRWADRLDALSRESLPTENKFARNGAYASSAEMAAYRHGLEKAAWLIRNRPDEEEPAVRMQSAAETIVRRLADERRCERYDYGKTCDECTPCLARNWVATLTGSTP